MIRKSSYLEEMKQHCSDWFLGMRHGQGVTVLNSVRWKRIKVGTSISEFKLSCTNCGLQVRLERTEVPEHPWLATYWAGDPSMMMTSHPSLIGDIGPEDPFGVMKVKKSLDELFCGSPLITRMNRGGTHDPIPRPPVSVTEADLEKAYPDLMIIENPVVLRMFPGGSYQEVYCIWQRWNLELGLNAVVTQVEDRRWGIAITVNKRENFIFVLRMLRRASYLEWDVCLDYMVNATLHTCELKSHPETFWKVLARAQMGMLAGEWDPKIKTDTVISALERNLLYLRLRTSGGWCFLSV